MRARRRDVNGCDLGAAAGNSVCADASVKQRLARKVHAEVVRGVQVALQSGINISFSQRILTSCFHYSFSLTKSDISKTSMEYNRYVPVCISP